VPTTIATPNHAAMNLMAGSMRPGVHVSRTHASISTISSLTVPFCKSVVRPPGPGTR
jgi:hypothetical protein